jgi:hypothetical protein
MRLAGGLSHPELRQAADLLRDSGVAELIRRLYYAYCAEVLGAIGELTRGDLAAPVVAFGDWLKAMYKAHGSASIFTLNYDLLLERMLIDDNVLGLKDWLTDFFSGLPARAATLPLGVLGAELRALPFYPWEPPRRNVHLHHLHGCLTHFRDTRTGMVFKISSADVRDHDVFGRLADVEASDYVPSVILRRRSRRVRTGRSPTRSCHSNAMLARCDHRDRWLQLP